MFLTVHSTAGIFLGSLTGNPILAFIMGLLSHFILDITPHGDEVLGRWAHGDQKIKVYTIIFIAEFSFAMLFVWLMFGNIIVSDPLPILAGMAGSVAPDFLTGAITIFPNKLWNWFDRLHDANHKLLQNPIPWQYGMGLQLLTLLLLTIQLR